MKKVYLMVLGIIFLLLTACGTNTPKGKAEEFLSRYNSLNDDVMVSINTAVAGESLSTTNQEKYRKVLERQYKNMKYEVKDETVDGDKASVKVKVTVYDLYKSGLTSQDYLNNNTNEFYVDNVLNQEAFDKYRIEDMLNTNETVEYDITLYLNKDNGTWTVENPDSVTLEKIHGLYDYDK